MGLRVPEPGLPLPEVVLLGLHVALDLAQGEPNQGSPGAEELRCYELVLSLPEPVLLGGHVALARALEEPHQGSPELGVLGV